MRALPDLSPLAESPSVFSQPNDDWNTIFAEEFTNSAGEQSVLDSTTPVVYAGMDPISQAIDSLSAALDLAGSVLDLLSGDLDLVNLDPIILDFQAQDNLLESGLNSFTIDTASVAYGLADIFNALLNPFIQAVVYVVNVIISAVNWLIATVLNLLAEIGLGVTSSPGPYLNQNAL